jgi:hypothetical protein
MIAFTGSKGNLFLLNKTPQASSPHAGLPYKNKCIRFSSLIDIPPPPHHVGEINAGLCVARLEM